MKPFSEVTAEIVALLSEEEWKEVTGFGASLDAALQLPLAEHFWYELRTPKNEAYNCWAIIRQGIRWNDTYKFYDTDMIVADVQAATLIEAVCRAWLIYKGG